MENKFHFQQHVYCTLRTENFLERLSFSFSFSRFQYQISQIKTYHIRELEFINTNICLKTFLNMRLSQTYKIFKCCKRNLNALYLRLMDGIYLHFLWLFFFSFYWGIISNWTKNTLDLLSTKKCKRCYFRIYESIMIFLIYVNKQMYCNCRLGIPWYLICMK